MSADKIGNTSEQLGQVEAASAMIIDGKIVTRDDYRALQAQIEALKQIAYLADGARVEAADGNGGEEKRWLHKLYCTVGEYDCTATPAACLAQVRAEAGRAGFVQGYIDGYEQCGRDIENGDWTDDSEDILRPTNDGAHQYADQIRRGEVE